MEHVYLWSAIAGGTLFVGQLLLGLLGTAADVDFDEAPGPVDGHAGFGHSDTWFVGMFSLRTIVAAVFVFGLAGMAAADHFAPRDALLIALAAAAGTMVVVGKFIQMLLQLNADGTVRIENAVGRPGTVYLTVPGQRSGSGKVTVKVQGRTMEFEAVTADETLPTGTPVTIVQVVNPGTVEIIRTAGVRDAAAVSAPTQS